MNAKKLHPRTAILNSKQKHQARTKRLQALNWLAKKFPESFDNKLKIRPLKTGIMHDLLAYVDEAAAHGISKTKLREAVVVFTRRIDYLACLKAKEMRIDLHGQPCAVVSDEEAERAAQKIKIRVSKTTLHAQQNIAKKVAEYYQNQVSTHPYPTTRSNPSITVKRKLTPMSHAKTVERLKEKLGIE